MGVKGLKIKVKSIKDDIKKVVLAGVIDGHTSRVFEKALLDLIDEEISKIVLDFGDVTYLSSAGVGVLISSLGRLEDELPDQPGDILILNPVESVKDVFQILEIESSFTFAKSEEDAIKILDSL
jgi:anti-sigma B factor antagonist